MNYYWDRVNVRAVIFNILITICFGAFDWFVSPNTEIKIASWHWSAGTVSLTSLHSIYTTEAWHQIM